MQEKATFGSKIGLIAATVGSAVGLGNIWRFPAETQAHGGAAFLIVYILCVILLGVPVMLGEFSLGRGMKSDAVGVYKKLAPGKAWWIAGAISVTASYLILSFYMVVAGWTLEYFIQSVTGNLFADTAVTQGLTGIEAQDVKYTAKMKEYIASDTAPLVFTYIMILINFIVVLMGVKKGIERLSNVLMPILFIVLVVFCGFAFTMPKFGEGISFFLNPDFSKINMSVIVNALGQAFFSLSLGMGILITYSSYFPASTKLVKTSLTVSLLDMLVAILIGVMIFPAVMSFGLEDHNFAGASLVFVTLPEVFAQMPGTQFWSILFFLLLFVAALTSTISLTEVTVAFLCDRFGLKRRNSCLIVVLPLFVLSSLCSLSQSSLSTFTIFGKTIFDFLDTFATNLLLPLGAIIMCVFLGWFVPKDYLKRELTNNYSFRSIMTPIVSFIIKWCAPLLIGVVMISQFI